MKKNLLPFLLLAVLACLMCGFTENRNQPTKIKNKPAVTLKDIQQAEKVLKDVALHTPLVPESALSKICNAQVFLKLENMQHTGSFKIRGAFNKIACLPKSLRDKGVITASAGNHAQGVALAARYFNIPAIIVMPETVPQTKLDATRAYGAKVILHGEFFDQALAKAIEMHKQTSMVFVHAFDDPATIAGQGTIGLEILEDLPDVDVVLIPVGGGGLASGIATAIKGKKPSVEIIGVEPANIPSMTKAIKNNEPVAVDAIPTIAEGTAVLTSGKITYPILKQLLDKLVLVSEEEISQAILLLLMKDKTLAEGAGALGAAALLSGKVNVAGKKVVLVISGGNIDEEQLFELVDQLKKTNL